MVDQALSFDDLGSDEEKTQQGASVDPSGALSFDDLRGSGASVDPSGALSFDDLGDEQTRGGTTQTMLDVGRGLVAAPITLTQGLVEAGALATDLFFDTEHTRRVTAGFEGVKEFLGATPEGTAGKAVEEIAAFGLGFIPIAGWLSRASSVARGARKGAPAASSGFFKAAETFGRSNAGKRMLNTRGRLAATTALAAGGYEALVSPDGYGTVADAFDFLPEFMQTEAFEEEMGGREDALRMGRNRLRRALEASAFSGTFDAALIGAGRAAPAVMQTPVIGPAVSATARGVRTAFEVAGETLGRVPGAKNINQAFQRMFTASGGVDARLFEELSDARALPNAAKKEALDYVNSFMDATTDTMSNLKLFGRGKGGVQRAKDDLFEFLTGQNYDALNNYPPAAKKAAEQMQRLTTEFEDRLLFEIDQALARFDGGTGQARRGPETAGIEKLERTRREILARRGVGNDLKGMENSQSTYLRRMFEMYEAPERFYARMDPEFMSAGPSGKLFREATEEVRVNLGPENVSPAEAQEEVLRILGLEMLNGDPNLTPQKALQLVRSGLKDVAEGKTRLLAKETSGIDAITSMFELRKPLLDKSPKLRELMGEVRDPARLYLDTIDSLSTTVANTRFARTLANSDQVLALPDALSSITQGGRPMLVDLQERAFVGLPDRPVGVVQTDLLQSQRAQLEQAGYRPLGDVSKESYSHPFFGRYGELTGLYAPPEVHDALNIGMRLAQGPLGEVAAMAVMGKALSQQMTVVMNPLSQIRNVLGNFYFLAGNANFGRDLDFAQSVGMTAANFADMTDDAAKMFVRHMNMLGVADTAVLTSQIRHYKDLGKDLSFSGKARDAIDKGVGIIPFSKTLNRTYSDVDTGFKIMNTMAEESKILNVFARADLDPTNETVLQAMLDNGLAVRTFMEQDPTIPFARIYAAEVTKEVMPTYPRVPKAVRTADMTPFFGAFVSFASENIRNSANTLGRGMKELSFSFTPQQRALLTEEVARKFEQGIRANGAARLTSYLTVATVAPAAASVASARAVGMSDEDVNAAYQLMADYVGEKGHAVVFSAFDGKGKVEYLDQSYVNPYAFTTDGARAALREYHRSGVLDKNQAERIASSAWAGLTSYAEPFGTESLVFERLRDVLPAGWIGRGGETSTGAPVYGQTEALGEKLAQSFNHVLGGFLPGYFREIYQPRQGEWKPGRLTRAMTNIPGSQGQDYHLQEEAARLVSGFTPMTLDLRNDFWYNGVEYAGLRTEAKGIAGNVIKRNDSTEADMLGAWDGYIDNLYRHQSALYADVLAAKKLGVPESDILVQLLKDANLGRNEAAFIMRGEFFPTGPSKEFISNMKRRDFFTERPRIVQNPPFVEFQRKANEQLRRPLSPQVGVESRTARKEDFTDSLRDPRASQAIGFDDIGSAPQTSAQPQVLTFDDIGSAPQAQAQGATPAPQPQPIQPAAAAPPAGASPARQSPGMLGTNPADILRNMELAQRTGGG